MQICILLGEGPNKNVYFLGLSFPNVMKLILRKHIYLYSQWIGTMLDLERPDLVIFTGDNVHKPVSAEKAIALVLY